MSYVPNYAQIVKNVDGDKKYPLRVELREFNDDMIVASLEITTIDDIGFKRRLGEWFDPMELPMYMIRELRKQL